MEDDEYTLNITSIDGTISTITIPESHDWISISDTIDLSNITFDRVIFEDHMPNPEELKRMCEEYPALEKAYENFKIVYKMVHQDWRGKQDQDSATLF